MHIKRFLSLVLLSFSFSIFSYSQIPSGYYDPAQGLAGEALKNALHDIIDGHDAQTYSSLWTHFQTTDVRADGKVWDMYSSCSFTFETDQCGTYQGECHCYNREHSFPKSWFNDASPMDTDLFHLVPTDGYVNGQRGNFPYGEVGTASYTSSNGSKKGNNVYPGYSGTVFEPIDMYKGDFARGYLYMAVRYKDEIGSWSSDMLNGVDGYADWALNLLLDWHEQDPVSTKEINRNDAIYGIQNNRNPFIDHPEYAAQIWGGVVVPSITDIQITPALPAPTESVSVSATVTDDGTISNVELMWGTTSGSLNNGPITMDLSKGLYVTSTDIPAQTSGTTVYFEISATDNDANTTTTSEQSYTITSGGTASLPYTQPFASGIGDMAGISLFGDQVWENAAYGNPAPCAKMSGYTTVANENEDWLITPALDFTGYLDIQLNFDEAINYESNVSGNEMIKISTDYTGAGDPSSATWTLLPISGRATGASWDFVSVNEYDLSAYIGNSSVYIAFQYLSNTTEAGTWEVDNISVTGTVSNASILSNTSNLSGFTYQDESGPSAAQSFTIEGSDLVGDLNLAAPTNYEISLTEPSGYTNSITLPQSGGAVSTTTIFVRLKAGLAVGNYNNEIITASSTAADDVSISCSGSVTAVVTGGGMEDFANYGNTQSAYVDGTFLGQDGSTWTYLQCRGDVLITNETPCLGRDKTPAAAVYSGTIAGGIGTINFDFMQAFSSAVDLNVLINDVIVANVTTSNEQNIVKNSGDITINVNGDFVMKFEQAFTAAGQVSIDNITWTGYNATCTDDSVTLSQSICQGESFMGYNQAGLHYYVVPKPDGCDSVYEIMLTVNDTTRIIMEEEICDGDSVLWQGEYYSEEGAYETVFQSFYGCDSVMELHLYLNDSYLFIENEEICEGDSVLWRGNYYSSAGIYDDAYQTMNNCDSIFQLQLAVNDTFAVFEEYSVCEGDSMLWQGNYYSIAGNYSAIYSNSNSCDSNYYLNLAVQPLYFFTEEAEICEGESYAWHGLNYSTTGVFYDSLTSLYDCDSVYELSLIVHSNPSVYLGIDTTILDTTSIILDAGVGFDEYLWNDFYSGQTFVVDSTMGIGDIEVWVMVTDSNNCYGYDTVVVTIMHYDHVSKLDLNEDFKIYPNPFGQFIIVEPVRDFPYSIKIYDALKQNILEIESKIGKAILPLNRINRGTYFLEIKTKYGVNIQKIIKS